MTWNDTVMTLSCFILFAGFCRNFFGETEETQAKVYSVQVPLELCKPHLKACNYTAAQACLVLLKLQHYLPADTEENRNITPS
jgi:hypothetical protein